MEYYEGQAEELKETIDRNEEEQEEHEELLKITNEKLSNLEEKREAQVMFWKNIYTSRVLSSTVLFQNNPQRAFLVKDDGCRTSLEAMDADINNLKRTLEETENELQKTAETSYETETKLEFVEQHCIPYQRWQLDTLRTRLHNESLRKERMNFLALAFL